MPLIIGVVRVNGAEEYHGSIPVQSILADEAHGFKSVHAGHLHVHQDEREFRAQALGDRFVSGRGHDEFRVCFVQDGFHGR